MCSIAYRIYGNKEALLTAFFLFHFFKSVKYAVCKISLYMLSKFYCLAFGKLLYLIMNKGLRMEQITILKKKILFFYYTKKKTTPRKLYTYNLCTWIKLILDASLLPAQAFWVSQATSIILCLPLFMSRITQHVQDSLAIRPSLHEFMKGKFCLTNPISFCDSEPIQRKDMHIALSFFNGSMYYCKKKE